MTEPQMPLFYQRLVPLNSERHRGRSVARSVGYGFARATNSVPLTLPEFPQAALHYPIVFTVGEETVPAILVGVREAVNRFITQDGAWLPNRYIPAYVRRYPFVFAENRDRKELTLCIDEDSPHYKTGGEIPLFADDKPAPEMKSALDFCLEFQRQWLTTQEFCRAIRTAGLLEVKQVVITNQAGKQTSLSGFQVIDEAKLAQLPDAQFLEWRHRGWLTAIQSHLISLGCLPILAEMEV